jgi:hypothetical protein
MTNTLIAFDLATVTGWACAVDGKLYTGRIDLRNEGKGAANKNGARFSEFVVSNTKLLTRFDPQCVFFEDASAAARRTSAAQAELWYGWHALLRGLCHELGIPIEPVNTATYKKEFGVPFRCGKLDVIRECNRRLIPVRDENEADAVAVLNVGLAQYGASLEQFKWTAEP